MNSKKINIKLHDISIDDRRINFIVHHHSCKITHDSIFDIEISNRGISIHPDWKLESIPLIYSQYIPLNDQNFELVINLRLENLESIHIEDLPPNTIFRKNFEIIHAIMDNKTVSEAVYDDYIENSQFEEYASTHNKAIISHYNLHHMGLNPEIVEENFRHASYLAPNSYWMAYTHYLFIIFLLENHKIVEAISVANQILRRELTEKLKAKVLITIYNTLTLSEIGEIYHKEILEVERSLQPLLDNHEIALEFYTAKSLWLETNGKYEEALELLDNVLISTEKKTYLYAQTNKTKADLFIKMAQMGSPHFYTSSLQCYHEALKVFSKNAYPNEYANCQMNIGIIYAEMPSVDKKKHIYSGLSQTAFSEAFSIFNKIDFPYEYATVCTNFGNAILRFLPSIDDDRFAKISHYFQEAIDIREALELYEEKAVALIGLLNLYYYRIESVEEIDVAWLNTMGNIATEILALTQNERFVKMAKKTLEFVKQNT